MKRYFDSKREDINKICRLARGGQGRLRANKIRGKRNEDRHEEGEGDMRRAGLEEAGELECGLELDLSQSYLKA
ncbi:unnamed protein product [Caenorhabditis bovis]|uniref:Uncharacterized protein n=1 Tax=Caenorhabditis bovis TaxID=2654633 RepID=A0A8S1EIT1_9PELO|nr:unnamed protein product [Caenorhabditis bovis]